MNENDEKNKRFDHLELKSTFTDIILYGPLQAYHLLLFYHIEQYEITWEMLNEIWIMQFVYTEKVNTHRTYLMREKRRKVNEILWIDIERFIYFSQRRNLCIVCYKYWLSFSRLPRRWNKYDYTSIVSQQAIFLFTTKSIPYN